MILQTAARPSPSLYDERSSFRASEEDLIRRAQVQDERALGALFDAYYPKLVNYGLLQFRDVHAAEDLASDVILRVLESIPRYRATGVPLSAWVFRIARNRLVDIRRRATRRPEFGLADGFPPTLATAPHLEVETALDYSQLSAALSRLTATQRQVIVLRYFRDLDIATVSRLVGRSQSAVKSLQFRALVSLRRILAGPEATPAVPAGTARPRAPTLA